MKTAALLIISILLLGTASSLGATTTKTTTTISSSLNPSIYGQAVTFTAQVTSALGAPPNGENVTFLQGQKTLGTGPLSSGSATFTISTLTAGGTDNVKAVYAGDANFAASTSVAVGQVVTKATTTTTVASSKNPSAVGQPVTFTATVTPEFGGTITGNVSFYNGSTKLGNGAVSGGTASYTTAKLAAGTDVITATYNGSTSLVTSTSTALSQVMGAGTFIDSTMTWNGITRYYEVYLPATLVPNPAMLLMLHGTKNTPTLDPQAVISLNWGWQTVADQYGFVLVKPASTYNSNTSQWNWDAYYMDSAFQTPPDDSGFLRQLITNLTAQYNVNPNQVYVAGFSSGAQMAHRIGVEISDLVAAIVIGSGTIVGQLSPPPIVLPGAPVAPVSIQEWHGTIDTGISPCNNGIAKYSGKSFYLATVDDSFNYWTQQNACTQLQNSQPLCQNGKANQNTTGNDATACTASTEVQFIWEQNIAHSWQEKNDAARWQFLAAHPKQ
jgi:poly(hydroxyalkanoate) depolymerase family esterase